MQCSTLPPVVNPIWLSNLTPFSLRYSSIFSLKIVHTILLLLTVTAIGLCSSILGLGFLGIIVVLDTSQSLCTSSTSALLKHLNRYSFISLSFINSFINSAGMLSIPVAFCFSYYLLYLQTLPLLLLGPPLS